MELRHARHLVLPDFGPDAQAALGRARVLIVGLGGLGVPTATWLAAAGVGQLVLDDFDTIDLSNLQRQPLYRPADVGQRKVAVAAARLSSQAPEVRLETVDARLDADALAALFARVDLGIDCSDNFGTRYALNEASRSARVPLLSGAAIRWQGQVAAFDPRSPDSPCYACLYAEGDEGLEDCRSNGILGPVAGVIGTLLATEAIKLLTGTGETLVGRLLRYDARTTAFQSARVVRDPRCAVCGVNA